MKKKKVFYRKFFLSVVAIFVFLVFYNLIRLYSLGLSLSDINLGYFFYSSTSYGYLASANNSSKKCRTGIRIVTGAIEMYNMDHSQKDIIKNINNNTINILLETNYLKENPFINKYKYCEYTNQGDLSTDEGFIYCKYHGDYEHNISGKCQIQERFLTKLYSWTLIVVLGFIIFVVVSCVYLKI